MRERAIRWSWTCRDSSCLGRLRLARLLSAALVTLPVQPVIQGVLHLAIGIVGAGVCGAVAFRPLMDLRGITMQLAAASARP